MTHTLELVIGCAAGVGTAAIVTPIAAFVSAGWKWGELDPVARKQVGGALLFVAIVSAGVALIASVLLALIVGSPYVAGFGGVVAAGGIFLLGRSVGTPVRSIHGLEAKLANPATRDQARTEILALVEKAADNAGTFPSVALAGATALANGRLHADALSLIDRVDRKKLSVHELELWSLCRLAARLHVRDLAGAREALGDVPVLHPSSAHADVLRICKATLLVLEGEPSEALVLLADEARDPQSERGRQVALAHAYAASGQLSQLQTCLRNLQREHGAAGVERVITPEGPASESAREVSQGARPLATQ